MNFECPPAVCHSLSPARRRSHWMAAITIFLSVGWAALVNAAPPANWEVMRVFIPDDQDQLDRLVTRSYSPILIEELAQQLAKESELRRESLLESPSLDEATYIARLEDELLISEHSRWKLSGKTVSQPFAMGQLSIALRPIRGILPDAPQLMDHALFTPTGALELVLPGEPVERWFGFTASAVRQGPRRKFQFRLPPAPTASLLVAAPAAAKLTSNTIVVEPIASPTGHLPGDWTVAPSNLGGAASQWWLINLSGVSEFDLTVEQQASESMTWYKHLVRSSQVDCLASTNRLDLRGLFIIAQQTAGGAPLRLRLAKELHIGEVLLNNVPAAWRVQRSPNGDANLIELLDFDASRQDAVVEIEATCAVDTSSAVSVPEISISESYSLDGRTRVFGNNDLIAENLAATNCLIKRLPLSEIANSNLPNTELINHELSRGITSDEPLVWQAVWMGSPPRIEAAFSKRVRQWSVRSLTRFSIQSDWLSASCRLHIDSRTIDSNELRMRVGQGWFIDNVKLVQAGSDIRARLEDRVIILSWDGKRDSVALELDVIAHSPRDTNAESIGLRSQRLVTLPGADQIDNYVVEVSSRYRVEIGVGLLAFQLQPVDLPDWQQLLLPQSKDKWIFRGDGGEIPPITLTASGGTFSSKVATLVRREAARSEQQLSVRVEMLVTPLSGSIDRVVVELPAGLAVQPLTWELRAGLGETTVPISARELSSGEDNEQVGLVELELPGPVTTAFRLRTVIPLQPQANGQWSIPILGTPAAVSGESLLLLPAELANPVGRTVVELLPATTCCSDNGMMQLFATAEEPLTRQLESMVLARFETGVSQYLPLQERQRTLNNGWAWRERIEHKLFSDGEREHNLQWIIEATQEPVSLRLPATWHLEIATLNGEKVDLQFDDQDRLLFELPAGEVSTLRLKSVSRHSKPAWLSREILARPEISVPVLDRYEAFWLPPARMPVKDLPIAQRGTRLVDRLTPQVWWKLLAPSVVSNTPMASPQPDWSLAEIQDGDRSHLAETTASLSIDTRIAPPTEAVIWTVNRNAYSAMALALVIAISTCLWCCLGNAVRLWWLAFASAAVSVVLVPVAILPFTQLLMLSTVIAAVLRLFYVVIRMRMTNSKPRGNSGIHSRVLPNTNTLALLLIGLFPLVACAQPTSTGELGASPQADERPRVFGVLIPVDEDDQVSGAYAYAPTRLLELLSGSEIAIARTSQPRISSADYTLRIRRSAINQREQAQELSVELGMQVSQADSEILLPFRRSELRLVRAAVDGQDVFIGGRTLYQLANSVVFRPNATGRVRLDLQFEPVDSQTSEEDGELNCQIPPIPTTTLRIMADGNMEFTAISNGGGQRIVSSSSTELLGPISRLNVRWSQSPVRGVPGQMPVEVYADTWLHARGWQLAAVCQLRILNGRTLPRDLHIIAEPGWEPVGVSWGDGELIGNELSSLGGRRVYTIRCVENWNELPQLSLRVIMVPRGADTSSSLSLPFFSLREVSTQAVTRTLAWSSDGEANWRPDGIDFWQELAPGVSLDWGGLGFQFASRIYRVPAGSMTNSIRRMPAQASTAVDEITDVHLGSSEAQIYYRAQTQAPDKRPLAVVIPKAARVDSVRLDGNIPRYRVSQSADQSLIEILPRDVSNSYEVVEVEVSFPLRRRGGQRLPRVVLRDFSASSSMYSLLLGAGLDCQLDPEADLKLESVSPRPTDLLSQLETHVGQVNLQGAYRNQAELPLRFTVSPRAATPPLASLLTIQRSDQGWSARLRAVWETESRPLDYVFFELPTAVRESVDTGQMLANFMPMGDTDRMTLCLIPPPSQNGRTQVEFSFKLPSVSLSQALSIPRIAVLSPDPIYPILALPDKVDEKPVRWLRTGRRLNAVWDNPFAVDAERNGQAFQYFELEKSQTQVSWKPLDNNPLRTELLASQLVLITQAKGYISGDLSYWVQAHGELSLPITLPDQCELLGVEIGGRPAIWQSSGANSLAVLLQPNYLPVPIRILLRWKTEGPDARLELPQLPSTQIASDSVFSVVDHLQELNLTRAGVQLATEPPQQFVANRWAKMLLAALPTLSNMSSSESGAWLSHWRPSAVGLTGTETLPAAEVLTIFNPPGSTLNRDQVVSTVEEFWQMYCAQAGLNEPPGDPSDEGDGSEDTSVALSLGGLGNAPMMVLSPRTRVVALASVQPGNAWAARLTAASLLAAAALLVLVVADRLRMVYFGLLAAHPWVYWLLLAALCELILPVSWPSIVLALTAAGMLTSQWVETRRRNRLMARA